MAAVKAQRAVHILHQAHDTHRTAGFGWLPGDLCFNWPNIADSEHSMHCCVCPSAALNSPSALYCGKLKLDECCVQYFASPGKCTHTCGKTLADCGHACKGSCGDCYKAALAGQHSGAAAGPELQGSCREAAALYKLWVLHTAL